MAKQRCTHYYDSDEHYDYYIYLHDEPVVEAYAKKEICKDCDQELVCKVKSKWLAGETLKVIQADCGLSAYRLKKIVTFFQCDPIGDCETSQVLVVPYNPAPTVSEDECLSEDCKDEECEGKCENCAPEVVLAELLSEVA